MTKVQPPIETNKINRYVIEDCGVINYWQSFVRGKHPIKYTIKKGCISFQVKQPSMVVSPSFFIPFFPFVWQHL